MTRWSATSVALVAMIILGHPVRPVAAEVTAEVWISSEDLKHQLTRQPPLQFAPTKAEKIPTIQVDPTRRYQKIFGMGSSLEPTTCYNISRLAPDAQDELIRRLVDPVAGIGMNLIRICIGTPDFTGDPWYSYDDLPKGQIDEKLEHFSIEKDRRYILPIIQKARKANPDLLFFASPWSPPGWMKSTGDMIGGHLLPKYYEAYARYFVRFIQAYEAEGIPIYAVTVQNEPGVDRSRARAKWRYPSCRWTGEQERDFIKGHLGPAFRQAGLKTKIWSYDHNFNEKTTPGDPGIDYPTTVLKDSEAAAFVTGVGFHGYEGKPSGMGVFHQRFPNVPIHFTEGSVFGIWGARQLMDYLENWACSYNAWVMMIDDKGGPNNGPFRASKTCIMLDSRKPGVTYRNDYFFYGQFMKFIGRGAVRIGTEGATKGLGAVAFENPDGRTVLILANSDRQARTCQIVSGALAAAVEIPPSSVATCVWKAK